MVLKYADLEQSFNLQCEATVEKQSGIVKKTDSILPDAGADMRGAQQLRHRVYPTGAGASQALSEEDDIPFYFK